MGSGGKCGRFFFAFFVYFSFGEKFAGFFCFCVYVFFMAVSHFFQQIFAIWEIPLAPIFR